LANMLALRTVGRRLFTDHYEPRLSVDGQTTRPATEAP
jgi:hypothetical protein